MRRGKMRRGKIGEPIGTSAKRKKNLSAYFTVEAAMVFPIVFSVILLVLYLLLFQYNRCLQEQDIGILALKGCNIQTEDKEAKKELLEKNYTAVDWEKYLAWEREKATVTLEKNKVQVKQKARFRFPFASLLSWDAQEEWQIETTFENQITSPVDFVRICKKIEKKKDETESKKQETQGK